MKVEIEDTFNIKLETPEEVNMFRSILYEADKNLTKFVYNSDTKKLCRKIQLAMSGIKECKHFRYMGCSKLHDWKCDISKIINCKKYKERINDCLQR